MGKDTQPQKTRSSNVLRQFASGGVVFKKVGDEVLWLVTKNSPSEKFPGEFWRLPKGWIDDRDNGNAPGQIASGEKRATEEEIQNGALREVREEGGVEAKVIKKIGTSKYFSSYLDQKILKFVTFYLMEFVRDLPEGFGFETSEIQWLSFDKAKEKLSRDTEKQILTEAKNLLG